MSIWHFLAVNDPSDSSGTLVTLDAVVRVGRRKGGNVKKNKGRRERYSLLFARNTSVSRSDSTGMILVLSSSDCTSQIVISIPQEVHEVWLVSDFLKLRNSG